MARYNDILFKNHNELSFAEVACWLAVVSKKLLHLQDLVLEDLLPAVDDDPPQDVSYLEFRLVARAIPLGIPPDGVMADKCIPRFSRYLVLFLLLHFVGVFHVF